MYEWSEKDYKDELASISLKEYDRVILLDAWVASNLKPCIDTSSAPGKNFKSKLARDPDSLRSGRAICRKLRELTNCRQETSVLALVD